MLLFAHVGITLASTAIGYKLSDGLCHRIKEPPKAEASEIKDGDTSNIQSDSKPSFFGSLANHIDIRVLLVGSLLPDIIDKPIGRYLFWETFGSGRIFSHTLLFLVLVTAVGLVVKSGSGKTWGLALSIGTFFHLMLDQMWLWPKTLLWPTLGLEFQKVPSLYLSDIFFILLKEPAVYVAEIIGFCLTIWFVWGILRQRAIMKFLKLGRVY